MTMYLVTWRAMLMRDQIVETQAERLYLIFADLIAAIAFGAMAGLIFTQVNSLRISEEEFKKKMAELREFALAKGLPKQLQLSLTMFYKFLYEEKVRICCFVCRNATQPADDAAVNRLCSINNGFCPSSRFTCAAK